MNIVEIYNKYYLPKNLQMHMLRVAACSKMIIDNWNGPKIDKEEILDVKWFGYYEIVNKMNNELRGNYIKTAVMNQKNKLIAPIDIVNILTV